MGRWNVVDREAEKYERHSPYAYVLNRPTVAVDPDGKRVYFVGGANNDQDGWNYIQRWRNSFANHGINDVRRVNMSHGKNGDIEFTTLYRNSGYESVITGRQIRGGDYMDIKQTRPVEHPTINKTVALYKDE